MRGRFPPTPLHRYPGLLKKHYDICKRFLLAEGNNFESVDYNVRVGDGVIPKKTWDEITRTAARELTQKRIDLVGYRPGEIWIIEITHQARVSVFGQIVAYRQMYIEDFAPTEDVQTAVVCSTIDRDFNRLLFERGVSVFRYPDYPGAVF